MKAIEKAQAIYDLTMNERCEAKVQDLFSNGLHKLMIDLIEELEELENRRCENCKHNKEQDNFMIFCDAVACKDGSRIMWHSYTKDFCCNKWEKE